MEFTVVSTHFQAKGMQEARFKRTTFLFALMMVASKQIKIIFGGIFSRWHAKEGYSSYIQTHCCIPLFLWPIKSDDLSKYLSNINLPALQQLDNIFKKIMGCTTIEPNGNTYFSIYTNWRSRCYEIHINSAWDACVYLRKINGGVALLRTNKMVSCLNWEKKIIMILCYTENSSHSKLRCIFENYVLNEDHFAFSPSRKYVCISFIYMSD